MKLSDIKSTVKEGEHEVRELDVYIDNNQQLYKQFESISKSLIKKVDKGVYDMKKSVKLFQVLVDSAAKAYVKEFGSSGDKWNKMFSVADRKELAKQRAEDWKEQLDTGDFDHLRKEK